VYVAAAQDDNDNDRFHSPKFTVNPPLSGAAIAGRSECVQVLVDEVGIWIDEPDACFRDRAAVNGYAVIIVNMCLSEALQPTLLSLHTVQVKHLMCLVRNQVFHIIAQPSRSETTLAQSVAFPVVQHTYVYTPILKARRTRQCRLTHVLGRPSHGQLVGIEVRERATCVHPLVDPSS
jgi:hypothetical protein